MFTKPPTPSLHSEVHSTAAVVNQLSCAPDTQGWLADSPAATSFELLHPCLWTCATWSHHLRHMEHLMHTYTPTPQSLLWDTVSKPSLKTRIPEGFSSTVPKLTLQREFQRIWERRPTEKIEHKTKWWDLEVERKLHMGRWDCNNRESEEKNWGCTSRTARGAKKPRHPDFQDNVQNLLPYSPHLLTPSSASNLLPDCRCLKGPWEAAPREDNRKRGKWRKKKLDRDQTLPHGTEQ